MTQKKVEFLIMGAQRGGTTALYSYLWRHPETQMSKYKETLFFDNYYLSVAESKREDFYHSHFSDTSKVWGEATPSYMYHVLCYPRIKEYNPNMKMLFMLRDPCDRAYSHWQMNLDDKKKIRLGDDPGHLQRSLYATWIKKIMDYFPKKQMLFIKNEELMNDPNGTMLKVFAFLGLGASFFVRPLKVILAPRNAGDGISVMQRNQRKMPKTLRKITIPVFLEDIKALEKITKWDLTSWKTI